jgi:hypothetical protein
MELIPQGGAYTLVAVEKVLSSVTLTLDSASSVNVFRDKELLVDARPTRETITGVGGVS